MVAFFPARASVPLLALLLMSAACGMGGSADQLPPGAEAAWQMTLPSQPVPLNSAGIRLQIRNRMGQSGETYDVWCRVVTPTGEASYATAVLEGDSWGEVVYPGDFLPEDEWPATGMAGTYTVIWYIDEQEVTRGAFTVR